MNKKYTDRLSQEKVSKICQIINTELYQQEAYLQQGLTAKMLAARNGISVQDISAVCSEYFGGNFSVLLQRLRVKRVCRMLDSREYDKLTCELIGLRCGFANRQSLYNAFRRLRGMTPEQYRQNMIKANEKNSNTDDNSSL